MVDTQTIWTVFNVDFAWVMTSRNSEHFQKHVKETSQMSGNQDHRIIKVFALCDITYVKSIFHLLIFRRRHILIQYFLNSVLENLHNRTLVTIKYYLEKKVFQKKCCQRKPNWPRNAYAYLILWSCENVLIMKIFSIRYGIDLLCGFQIKFKKWDILCFNIISFK